MGPVPADITRSPTRTALEKPTFGSHGDPEETRCLLIGWDVNWSSGCPVVSGGFEMNEDGTDLRMRHARGIFDADRGIVHAVEWKVAPAPDVRDDRELVVY